MTFAFRYKNIYLKKGKAKPFWHKHPWVFSGAIQSIKGDPQNGDIVEVYDEDRKFIAKGFYNKDSQIAVRLLSWNLHEKIDFKFFENKISEAIVYRENILALASKTNAYRLIHGEADGLPGFVVDRYGDILCAQFTSAGMDSRRDMILAILTNLTKVKTIVERYSPGVRELEGLPKIDYLVHGPKPPADMIIQEYGLKFNTSLEKGQKTGFYIDQRENRLYASKFGYGKRVLDACCYTGAFGIYLAKKGKAKEVVFLDTSKYCLAMAEENAKLNGCENTSFRQKDIFVDLDEMIAQKEKFDIVVLDPPKVVTSNSNLRNGLFSLRSLNAKAMQLLSNQGILITCDCSGIISLNDFIQAINKAALDCNANVKIINIAGAGSDHPINAACPENSYLKTLFVLVTHNQNEEENNKKNTPEKQKP